MLSQLTPHFLLPFYYVSILYFTSHLKLQTFSILFSPYAFSAIEFHGPRGMNCVSVVHVLLMDRVEVSHCMVGLVMGGVNGGWMSGNWFEIKPSSAHSDPHKCLLSVFLGCHLTCAGHFEIGWVTHQLQGVRDRFLCGCQGPEWEGINSPKGETSSIGNGRGERATPHIPSFSSLR